MDGAVASNPDGDFDDEFRPANAIDGSGSTNWLDRNEGFLDVDFGQRIVCSGFSFTTGSGEPEDDPKSFQVFGSNDQSDWQLLLDVSNYHAPDARSTESSYFPWGYTGTTSTSTTATSTTTTSTGEEYVLFRYYRFLTIETRAVSSFGVQLSELGCQRHGSDVSMEGAEASNPDGNFDDDHVPAHAIDGDAGSDWLDRNKGDLIIDFGEPCECATFSFTTASDDPFSDPTSFKILGSLDSVSWVVLLEQFSASVPIGRSEETERWPLQVLGAYVTTSTSTRTTSTST
jgi:hypothetical protein